MSLINVFGDGVLDVWAGAFGDVWLGVEVVFVPAAPCRLVDVEAETRTIIVAAEARIITVDAENRIVEVSCQ